MWHVGIDVGGTFTDLFAANGESGATISAKVLTTAGDRSVGVLNALEAAEIAPAEISMLVHGTTTATNALVERSYPPVAMVTTEGFRDVIEIGRQRRQHLFALRQKRPTPIVPRRLRFTLGCRLSAAGEDLSPFDDEEARGKSRGTSGSRARNRSRSASSTPTWTVGTKPGCGTSCWRSTPTATSRSPPRR